ncbi:MAG: response regulator transcription factor [Clostridium sp.]
MRLLIIEDNKELAYNMKSGLENLKFIVDVANYGEDGEEKACVNNYDVILLDLNLPDKDGLDILKFLRSYNVETPVIIISARDEIEERALGLDLGADDYITKPFEIVELRARIQAVVRRFYGRSNPIIRVGILEVNPHSRKVIVNNKEVNLGTKEFDIVEYIANKHPAVVSSEDIAEHIYDEFFDPMSSVLRVHIAKLKKKLKEAADRDVIQTIRGKGYSLWED